MADHTVVATPEDELGMDHIRTIDKDASNTNLIQRVMQGHWTEWNKMAKVIRDRGEAGVLFDKLQQAKPEVKAQVVAILDAAEKPIEEVIPK